MAGMLQRHTSLWCQPRQLNSLGKAGKQGIGGEASWATSLLKGTLDQKGRRMFVHHLQHAPFLIDEEDEDTRDLRARFTRVLARERPHEHEVLNELVAKAKAMDRNYRLQQKTKYQQWMEKATEGGMRGLYRSQKKPKVKTAT